jgi:hypothetical protein
VEIAKKEEKDMAQGSRSRHEESIDRIRKERFSRIKTAADVVQFEYDFGSTQFRQKPPVKGKKENTNGRPFKN